MIYFLHIKNTDELNCKLFFHTITEMNDYLIKFIPDRLTTITKKIRIQNGEEVISERKTSVQGRDLQNYLEGCTDITMINEHRIPNYQKLFKGEFLSIGGTP